MFIYEKHRNQGYGRSSIEVLFNHYRNLPSSLIKEYYAPVPTDNKYILKIARRLHFQHSHPLYWAPNAIQESLDGEPSKSDLMKLTRKVAEQNLVAKNLSDPLLGRLAIQVVKAFNWLKK